MLLAAGTAHAQTAPGPPETSAGKPSFTFHSTLWVNLHHFLYVLGRARSDTQDSHRAAVVNAPADTQGFESLCATERETWDRAIACYQKDVSPMNTIFYQDLIAMTNALAAGAINDVPGPLIRIVVPVANIDYRRDGGLLQNLVAAMFLCGGESLVRINLEEGNVKYLSGRVRRSVTILDSGINAACRCAVGRAAGPCVRLRRALGRRSKAATPNRPFAIMPVPVAGRRGLEPVRLRIQFPAAGRNIYLLESRTPADEFGAFRFGLRRLRRFAGFRRARAE